MTDTEQKAHLQLQHPGTQSNSTATTIGLTIFYGFCQLVTKQTPIAKIKWNVIILYYGVHIS